MVDEHEATTLEREVRDETAWDAVADVENEEGWSVIILHPHTHEPQITLHNRNDYDLWRAEQVFNDL